MKIEWYPVIKEYKYLGITINDKIKINKHVYNIDKKIGKYFARNYILNKIYFSVKSIMLIFDIFKQNNSYKKWNSNSKQKPEPWIRKRIN